MTTPPDHPALVVPVPPPRAPADAAAGSFLLRDLELSERVPAFSATGASRALLLVRLFTEPLGLVEVPLPAKPADIAGLVWTALGSEVNRRVVASGGDPRTALGVDGIRLSGTAVWVAERDKTLARAPAVSVVLCTRDRADRLAPCLDRLRAQAYPAFEIVVVDNAPTTDAVRRLVDDLDDLRVRYVVEPRPGLSRARNAGVTAARHDLIAFIDDDESADVYWLAELARGFAAAGGVGCVSGMILPAELETQPQVWFEEYGGHSKGRGFRTAVIDPADRSGQSPLYPLPPFGAGGNMAFTRAVLARIGGFDEAMGAGTAARGGEDTAAFTDVLLAGFRLVYQPSAFVRHTHYRTLDGLRTQMYGYGSGLTAYYTRLLLRSPQRLPALIRLLPTALRDMVGKNSARTGHLPTGFPRELMHEQRRGMLRGPGAYLHSRLTCRRAGKPGRAGTTGKPGRAGRACAPDRNAS
ncbi:MAG: glycosyltransferase family 2 protein [Frankiaceae bacterium]